MKKKGKLVSFKATRVEAAIIRIIAIRYVRLVGPFCTQQNVEMDITACHANGCRLDLERLAAASDSAILHDVGGIRQHLDRRDGSPTAGQLLNCFLPRMRASVMALPPRAALPGRAVKRYPHR